MIGTVAPNPTLTASMTAGRRAASGRPANDTIRAVRARDYRWLLMRLSGYSLAEIACSEPDGVDRATVSRGIAAARRRAGEHRAITA
jgi:hypothetical protein